MPLPLFLLRRGLLGFMDEEDKPRGLSGRFGDDPDEDQSVARSNPGQVAQDGSRNLSSQGEVSDERPGYAQRQIDMALRQILTNPLGVHPITQNPLTGEINVVPYAKSVGERYFDTWSKLPFQAGMGPPGPTAPAPVTTLSRSVPGLLFGGPRPGVLDQPRAEEAGNEFYHLPPEDDLGEDENTGHRRVRGGGKYWFPETKEPGPLERLKLDRPEIEDPVKSFRGGAYFERELPEDTVLYRVWGRPEGTKMGASELGHWWTKTPPSSPVQSTIDSAIQPSWGNTFQKMTSIRVPKGTTVYYGDVGPQDALVGGGWQYYLPTVDPEWIMMARPFR